MHELGICDAILHTVRGVVQEEQLPSVTKITVEVGLLSGVIPRFLEDCWVAVADGTEFEQTEFVVEALPGTARCLECGEEFQTDLESLRCPRCGGVKLTPLSGRDLTIKEIEAPY